MFLDKFSEANKKSQIKPMGGLKLNKPLTEMNISGDVGIEFELEGSSLLTAGYFDGLTGSKSRAVWLAKRDGSLRNGGMEYVVSEPIYYDEITPMVEGFFERFEKHPTSKIKNTNRCSTHVHVNVSSFKVNELTSAIALWLTLEEALIAWCGEERAG